MIDESQWLSGPPPHVGWWNVKVDTVDQPDFLWSWWNGEHWSAFADETFTVERAAYAASTPGFLRLAGVLYRHAYPASARVPRVAP